MGGIAFTSVANQRRLQAADAWLAARSPAEEVLVLGSTMDAANELARRAAAAQTAAFGWHRLTLPRLAAVLSKPLLADRKLAPLSWLGSEGIAARIAHRLRVEGNLGRYECIADAPGFSRAIAGVIAELKLAKVASGEIGKAMPDLAPLMMAYEAELAEAGLTDWPGVLDLATEAVACRAWSPRLACLPVLLLDVPIASKAEANFIDALAASAPEVWATVPAADRPTLDRIRGSLGWEIQDLDGPPEAADQSGAAAGALATLRRRLFNEQAAVAEAPPVDGIEVFSSPGEGRECIELARRVLTLARNGTTFDRIAVLLRSPEAYRTHLEEAFTRAGIPAHFARGAVRPDPAGRAFCALLKCAAEGLSARWFAEYLSLGQVPDADPEGRPPSATPRSERWVVPDTELMSPRVETAEDSAVLVEPDVDVPDGNWPAARSGQLRAPRRWERLLVEAAVIGGRDRWQRRVDGLANELGLRLAELDAEEEVQATTLRRAVQDLDAFAGYALPLVDDLDRLPANATWGAWLDQLEALATRSLRKPDRVLAVLAELSPMTPVGPVTLAEVLGVLENLLLDVAQPPSSQRYGKVFVAPIEAARGLSFDAVFVPGLAEKMFPRRIVEEPILLDAVRETISGELATNQTRLEGERLALALAAGAAEQRICFSYPRLDLDQARPRVPSFYALEIIRAAEGRLPDFTELARRAETSTTARLGWPAPPDPVEAIDEAEYDLAILDRLVRLPDESAGAARYLLTANPWLARALRARYQRWSRGWTSADGLTSQSALARSAIGRHALNLRSYSPTALQNFARCPYKFFLQAIQGLAPREVAEAIDELDPLQRGSLIHEIQFALLQRLRQTGLLPVRPGNLDRVWKQLDVIIADAAGRSKDDLAPAIDRVWEDGVAAVRTDLREWLRRMAEDSSGYEPRHFELSFGLGHRPERRQADPRSVPVAVDLACDIQLRGSIDLVESHPDGHVRVTDHKTGKADAKRGQLVDGGKSLQPLLYALAAEHLFAREAGVACGRLYFCTSNGGFAEHIVPLDERAREAAYALADAVSEGVSLPFLPAAPDKKECERCDYRIVCGPHEERRTARKPQQALERLLRLRALP